MQREYLTDGEVGFVGLNSRDNPATLPKGYVSKSENFRLSRGVAKVRRGLKKFTTAEIYGPTKTVVGSGVYLNSVGQETVVIIVHDDDDDTTRIYKFNPDAPAGQSGFSSATVLTQKIRSASGVEVIQAIDKIFISRGHSERPLVWDLVTAPQEIPLTDEFPNCSGLMFCHNRIVAKGRHIQMDVTRKRDTICVSHFLEYNKWKLADAFTINQGGNDEVVSIVPWTMREFLILCRNSTFYLNVGGDRYATGQALSTDARLESLSVDVGCIASRSAVQVGGGVVFLSDNGVYELKPTQTGVPDGVKLMTLSDPMSAAIDDVIQRINKPAASGAVGVYWNNRYFLAVPVGENVVNNNTVLVYNFILKAWESIDTYPPEFSISSFIVAKRGSERRLFIIDGKEGVLLTEELEADEIGAPAGTPVLKRTPQSGPYAGKTGEYLPFRLTEDGFSTEEITGTLVTRSFTIGEGKAKRFSSVETDMDCPSGSIVSTYAVTTNPDTETKIDEFVALENEDTTRRNPVRKIAYGLQIKFVTSNLQPTIRSNFVKFTINSKTNQNKT